MCTLIQHQHMFFLRSEFCLSVRYWTCAWCVFHQEPWPTDRAGAAASAQRGGGPAVPTEATHQSGWHAQHQLQHIRDRPLPATAARGEAGQSKTGHPVAASDPISLLPTLSLLTPCPSLPLSLPPALSHGHPSLPPFLSHPLSPSLCVTVCLYMGGCECVCVCVCACASLSLSLSVYRLFALFLSLQSCVSFHTQNFDLNNALYKWLAFQSVPTQYLLQFGWVQFGSRWSLCAWKRPHALHSQKFPYRSEVSPAAPLNRGLL